MSSCDDVFTFVTDATSRGIGSVSCVTRDKCDMPVAFHSRQLRDREKCYSASEMEGLAIVEAIRHFEVYLFGSEFTVVTDHKALTHLFSSTVLNAKLWRWALYLQQFSITFRYLPGRFNVVADCLSWQIGHPPLLQTRCQTLSRPRKLFLFRMDQGKETKITIPLLVLKIDFYLNRGECGRSHTRHGSTHIVRRTGRQTSIYGQALDLNRKQLTELLMTLNNIVII